MTWEATSYRKKATVEAFQFVMPMNGNMPDWLRSAFTEGAVYYQGGDSPYLTIETPHGKRRAEIGDWVILCVAGDLTTCKPENFDANYELVQP